MVREPGFFVELVELGALLVLAVWVARLRARGRRLAREGIDLSLAVVTVQSWAAQEIRALRSEFTVARVNDSAAEVMARRAEARAASAAPLPKLEDEEPRDTVAMAAPGTPAETPSDEDATTVIDRDPPMYAARFRALRPSAPLAHPDLIGCEDIADEAAPLRLGADESTPPRRGRSAVLVPAFRDPPPGERA